MMIFRKSVFYLSVLSLVLVLSGCATVVNEYDLPDQGLDKPVDSGKTRVIFYNSLNPLFLDGSWRIGLELDDVGVENLHLYKYVQVFLQPGQYKLGLSHVDVFTFKDEYPFEVGSETMFVKVYNGLVSTKYKIQQGEPENFRTTYQPALAPKLNGN